VDRHLKELVEEGTLHGRNRPLSLPKETVSGKRPPEDAKLVASFLKEHHFLLASPNAYNSLGVGTTQLYDKDGCYIASGTGKFALGRRVLIFGLSRSRNS